jgi:3-deoxy-D-manno-octulosonic-acid transferase
MNHVFPTAIRWAFRAYDQAWIPAQRGLRHHVKLREGFAQRIVQEPFRHSVDVWIQAASAGESHLAAMLMAHLRREGNLQILATTNTRQGMDILARAAARLKSDAGSGLQTRFCPFDRPSIMQQAVQSLKPRLMVLLETELWPGLLFTLRQTGIPVIMVNARLQARSLRAYRLWPALWRMLAPQRILAISRTDAGRLARLFGRVPVETMPNMKFDRIARSIAATPAPLPDWTRHLPSTSPFVVLGSIRREEESAVVKIIDHLQRRYPQTIVGLFPRHMHRVATWCRHLQASGRPYRRRSRIDGPIPGGTIVIGDIFGELTRTYAAATAVFVGGSLAPLGGHNFLEPLLSGIAPVVGPHRQTFEWVGPELFRNHLVQAATDWRDAARRMAAQYAQAADKSTIQRQAMAFFDRHRGGTAQACRAIRDLLNQA